MPKTIKAISDNGTNFEYLDSLRCPQSGALWSLFEQQGDRLVRKSDLELPWKSAVGLWQDELTSYLAGKSKYQSKLRPVVLNAAGKLSLFDWQGGCDAKQ